MQLEAIQAALRQEQVDGWLLYDFHHRDLMAYRILGLDPGHTSRRWFYFIPARGEPVKLAHRVEPTKLDGLPGHQLHYLAWTELHERLREMVGSYRRIAMQYSPMNQIPYVSVVDAGTVELVRSCGPDVVSSANLVQQFEAVVGEAGRQSHEQAADVVQGIKDEAFARMDRALRDGTAITEFEVSQFILARFEEEGMTPDGAVPIVGFNDHPANPHFEPTADNSYTLSRGDTILIDLWARFKRADAVFYDVTWCGFAGDEPRQGYREIFDAVRRGRDAALALVRERVESGQVCHGYEVDRAARAVIAEAGYGDRFLHRTGHNIGHEVHGNGANIDDLETRDERRLVPGTCFSIEPGIYLEGQMAVRSEIDVFITAASRVEVYGPIQNELIRIG